MISTSIEAKNNYKTNLEAYIVHQISDENGKVLHIDWSRVFAPKEGEFMINHNCDVMETGKYVIDIFIFNNMENPVSYSTKFTETIII